MKILVVDFETRWDSKEYTLSKLTTESYIRDPRFKAFGIGVKEFGSTEPAVWISHDDIQAWVDSVDWANTGVLAHNAQFDVAILAWVYGARPKLILDSLSMARALRGVEVGNSLATLAEHYGLPAKGKAVNSTNGLAEISYEIEQELADYCLHDVFLCEQVFNRLNNEVDGGFPKSELRLIDLTLKMFCYPTLELDEEMLHEAIAEEKEKREALLAKIGIEEVALASNDKFADVLLSLGVTPPKKISKTTGKEAYALAKNDALFQALLNSDNEDVSLLCEARLKVKSTLERTRAQRFVEIAGRGTLPVPLNYYGAHTGRWSASKGSGLNLQNLKRGSFLRKSIKAPSGYSLVVCDLSQIEPRVLAHIADHKGLLDIFASGQDAYSAFGAQMFGIPNLNKKDHPDLRQSAKSALLGCGYGMGWASFAAQLLTGFLGAPPTMYDRVFANTLHVTKLDANDFMENQDYMRKLEDIPHTCTDQELFIHALCAKKIISKYREASEPVVAFWNLCGQLIEYSLSKGKPYEYKCLTFDKERIILPSGLWLRYPNLEFRPYAEGEKPSWCYQDGKKTKRLYGGKLVENIVQAVARCVMTDGMLRIQKRYPCVLTVHDEVVVLVPDAEVEEAEKWVYDQMVMNPSYLDGIPLDAEASNAKRYGDAK